MATNVTWVKVDGDCPDHALREAGAKLHGLEGELVLDFSSVRRIDPALLRAMESLADKVNGAMSKLVLSGVSVEIYKVLKLSKLASRFSFRP